MAHINPGKLFFKVLIDEIKTILYFPLWWYSKGLWEIFKLSENFIVDIEQTLGLGIWVKNLFVPMFGQTDLSGRLISVLLRIVQIIFKSVVMVLVIIFVFIFDIAWILLPVFALYQAFIHLI